MVRIWRDEHKLEIVKLLHQLFPWPFVVSSAFHQDSSLSFEVRFERRRRLLGFRLLSRTVTVWRLWAGSRWVFETKFGSAECAAQCAKDRLYAESALQRLGAGE